MTARPVRLCALPLLAALFLTACGGDDDPSTPYGSADDLRDYRGQIDAVVDAANAIQSAIENMADKLDDNDKFLFYFSGHGAAYADVSPFDEIDGLDEFLVTYAFENISDDEMGQWFDDLPTNDYLVIIDSCGQAPAATASL